MAKKPTQASNDPAALAFSAVEDALKGSVFNIDEVVDEPAPAPRFRDGARADRLRTAEKLAGQTGPVANDDRLGGARFLQGLQGRSSPQPTYVAIGLSVVWVVAVALAVLLRGRAEGAPLFANATELVGFIALLVLPPAAFFAIATLIRRAQDLRVAATSISQAAMRLTEPETAAAEKVASVGQAVRREVNALGDGLERALSRAGELEVLIHNEVSALERTYSENEARMRALIQELASQRDSVITNTDRVREAITESHTGLVFDLDMISQRIAGTIVESGGNLTRALETAGNALTSSFGERTDAFVQLVDNRTADLVSSLDDSASRIGLTLEDRASTLSQALESRTVELGSTIEGRMTALIEALDGRSASLTEAIDTRTSDLSKLLSETGIELLDQLRDRGHEVSGTLEVIGTRIATDITERARDAEALLNGLTQQLDESVAVNVNAMESRLHTALIEISGNLDESTEKARLTLSGAGADTLGQLDKRLDEITGAIDSRLSAIDGVIGDKGERIVESLERHSTAFASRANVLEMALDEKSGHFNDIIGQRTRELTETLGQRMKEVTDTLSGHTEKLASSLEGQHSIIADALDGRLQALNDTLSGRAEEIASALESRTGALSEALDSRSRALSEAIETRTQELAGTLETRTSELTSTLDARTQELSGTLESRTHLLGQTVESRVQEITATLEGHTEVINETLDLRTRQLDQALDSRSRQLDSSLDSRTHQLDQALENRTQLLSSAIASRSNELSETLGKQTETLASTIGDRTNELARAIEAHGASVRDQIDQSVSNATGVMGDRTEMLTNLFAGKVAEMNDTLARGIDTAILRMADAETGVTARIDNAAETVGESARRAADVIESGVDSARKAITDMVDQRLGTLPEAITARADITAERLAALNSAINTAMVQSMSELEAGADRLEETISKRIVAATAEISTNVEASANRMDQAVRVALGRLDTAARSIQDIVEVKAVAAAEAVSGRVDEIHRVVDEHTNAFASLVDQRSEQLQTALSNHNNVLRDALARNAREAEGLMAATNSRIMTDVNAALAKLNDSNRMLQQVLEASTGNLATLETSIADRTTLYSNAVRDAIGSTEEAGKLVGDHVDALQTTIRGMIAEFGTLLGSLDQESRGMETAATSLTNASAYALTTLDERRQAMDALAQSFTARADDIDSRMRGFAQSIADTVNDTERRLIAARRTMEESLNETSSRVSAVLEESSSRVSAVLAESTNHLTEALNANTDRVGGMLEGVEHRFTGVFDDAEKRLHSVVAGTEERVGRVLASSEQQINETLNATTDRIASTLSTTTDNVASRLADIRTTASSEGQRADELLRQTQQTMIVEMQRALEEATKRFNETATAMRATAREVGSELEATRSELARGVVELPEETRASAAAMRRVVAEQIEALSELNDIVRSQSAVHDVSERRDPPRPAPQPRPEPAAPRQDVSRQQEVSRPVVRTEPERRPDPAPAARLLDQPARTEYRPAPQAPAASEPLRPATVTMFNAPVPSAAPTGPQPRNDDNGGWLRDVLRNASAKQAAAQPPQQNLSGLTDEIARAIDVNALVDAWNRYQGGEANVFSRRIYTLAGQGTYDEVRKKLQRDPEFARTAQAYMSEFEQLLKRAAAGDRPEQESRDYLLSDRGKVYTMLAHASGRLS